MVGDAKERGEPCQEVRGALGGSGLEMGWLGVQQPLNSASFSRHLPLPPQCPGGGPPGRQAPHFDLALL